MFQVRQQKSKALEQAVFRKTTSDDHLRLDQTSCPCCVTVGDLSYAHWVEPHLRLRWFDAPQQRPDGSPVGAVGVPQVLYVPAITCVVVSLLS